MGWSRTLPRDASPVRWRNVAIRFSSACCTFGRANEEQVASEVDADRFHKCEYHLPVAASPVSLLGCVRMKASEPTGVELERSGKRVLEQLGLTCYTGLAHAKLQEINPHAQYSPKSKCEFDYLVPAGAYALIGEITSRSPSNAEAKYSLFRHAFDAVRTAQLSPRLWQLLGVPAEGLAQFRDVRHVRGFFIASKLTAFDVDLPDVPMIGRFYRTDWEVVREYANILGRFAQTAFLHALDIAPKAGYRPIKPVVSVARHKKIVSGNTPTATLYTFEASPYDLLAVARVYRRDALPDLVQPAANKYQRPLVADKLRKIRKILHSDPDFIFPSAILGVLSPECRYDEKEARLELPDRYGAISIIDGQHRLFSYADDDVHTQMKDHARILVTAIHFDSAEEVNITQLSARTFVEINTNQTTVPRTHLDAIAYAVLGETGARALAAAVVLRVNARANTPLYGFFQTSQTALGIVSTTTIVGTLKGIVDIDAISRLRKAQSGKSLRSFQGYERLFGRDILEVITPDALIDAATAAIDQYFKRIAKTFHHDWPMNRERNGTCFENAKFVAAWIRLLKEHISRGSAWVDVQASLTAILKNVTGLNGLSKYTRKVFDLNNPAVPTARYSERDAYKFLVANERQATAITEIVQGR
jgi:DGQHR domain-containing protein